MNTSRGSVIDERALVEALQSGKLAGAALDVVETEPLPPPELLSLENCIVTPHAAFYSVESLTEVREKCARLVLDALTGKKIRNIVNEPPEIHVLMTGNKRGAAGAELHPRILQRGRDE